MKRFPMRSLAYWGILTVEAANKNIKKIVQKMAFTYKDGHEMLPFSLHGYCTSVRTSTGATPFSLRHGGRASRGGRSPVNEIPNESQACLNLNA